MKRSPKKSPVKQKTKLTDFSMSQDKTDKFFDKKKPNSPDQEKHADKSDDAQMSPIPDKKKSSKIKSKFSSPSKELKEDEILSSQKNKNTEQIIEKAGKVSKKKGTGTEPSTALGTSETNSASKHKQVKSDESSQNKSSQETGATAIFKKKQEGGGKKLKHKNIVESEDEEELKSSEEKKNSQESSDNIRKRDQKAKSKKSVKKVQPSKSPVKEKLKNDEEIPKNERSLRDRKKTSKKDQTQQSSIVDPTQKDDDDYEEEPDEKITPKKSKSLQKNSKPKPGDGKNPEKDLDPVSEDHESNDLDGDDDDFKEDPLNEMLPNDDEMDENEVEDDENFLITKTTPAKKTRTRKVKTEDQENKVESAEEEGEDDDNVFIDNLPKDENSIRVLLKEVNRHIRELEKQFFEEEDSEADEELKHNLEREDQTPEDHALQLDRLKEKSHIQHFWSIPISENVTELDFDKLAEAQMKNAGRLFDVITCDPPWQLSSANPTRGVAIAYSTLSDNQILNLNLNKIQKNGFLFIWVINNKYRFALDMFEKYGYRLVDEIAWVKQTVNGKIAKGHGFYLQHAKETCLVGVKGDIRNKAYFNIMSDVIFSQRRGQSQKPEEIYDLAESLVPDGYYLEIFARRNNLHNGWMSIGNEL